MKANNKDLLKEVERVKHIIQVAKQQRNGVAVYKALNHETILSDLEKLSLRPDILETKREKEISKMYNNIKLLR